jgi:hypothetical protein
MHSRTTRAFHPSAHGLQSAQATAAMERRSAARHARQRATAQAQSRHKAKRRGAKVVFRQVQSRVILVSNYRKRACSVSYAPGRQEMPTIVARNRMRGEERRTLTLLSTPRRNSRTRRRKHEPQDVRDTETLDLSASERGGGKRGGVEREFSHATCSVTALFYAPQTRRLTVPATILAGRTAEDRTTSHVSTYPFTKHTKHATHFRQTFTSPRGGSQGIKAQTSNAADSLRVVEPQARARVGSASQYIFQNGPRRRVADGTEPQHRMREVPGSRDRAKGEITWQCTK